MKYKKIYIKFIFSLLIVISLISTKANAEIQTWVILQSPTNTTVNALRSDYLLYKNTTYKNYIIIHEYNVDFGNGGSENDNGGILDGLKNLPEAIVNKFMEVITKPIDYYYKMKINEMTKYISDLLNVFQGMLTRDNFNSSRYSFAKSLWQSLLPIGYSLIGLFFIIEFCKKTIYFEIMNPLVIVKVLLKLALTKIFLDKSFNILALIIDINTQIVNKVFSIAGSKNASGMINYTSIINSGNRPNIIEEIFNIGGILLTLAAIGVLLMLCYVVINIRTIELAVLAGLAPIFFATAAGEATNDVFKSFLKNFISVAAQTIWMAVGFAFLTNGYVGSLTGSGIFMNAGELLIGVLTLTVFVIKAPSSIKSVIGGTGGAGNISIASIANLMK